MTFELDIGDRLRTVAVERTGEVLTVSIDGRLQIVDARRVDEASLSLLIGDGGSATPTVSVNAAVIERADSGRFDVHVDGRVVPAWVRPSGASRHVRRSDAGRQGHGPQRVTAPMPGKIVRVLVAPGQAVAARQGLVVVEAMKMENELRAARDGRVREVAVAEGQLVEAGAVLVTIE